MYTDTVSPHGPGMKFAIEYYGIDHIMYGTDYPCWDPATALKLLNELGLTKEDQEKLTTPMPGAFSASATGFSKPPPNLLFEQPAATKGPCRRGRYGHIGGVPVENSTRHRPRPHRIPILCPPS
jgi:hypothetical protein